MKKHAIGDRLKRRPGSGFLSDGEPSIVVIPDVPENHSPSPCLICEAPGCREWPTLWSDDGAVPLYHVSDCELEPV